MKRTLNLMSMAFLAIVMSFQFIACSESNEEGGTESPQKAPEVTFEEENISSNGVSFSSEAGKNEITFTATEDWTLTIASTRGVDWCVPSATSGKAGTITVTFTCTENTGYDDRSVVVTIKSGVTNKSFRITQKQKDALLLTTEIYELEQEGGSIDVEIKANIDYKLIVSESDQEWIKESSTRGLTTNKHTFIIAPSEEYDKREGIIYVKSGELTETIKIYQTGGGILLLSQNEYYVSDAGETISVDISSNFEYGIKMPGVDWIVEDPTTRSVSSHTLKYTIQPNESYNSRSAQIIYYDKNSNLENILTITQAEKADERFTNFHNFQEYVELVSNTIPQIEKSNWVSSFNWGEDEVITTGTGDAYFGSSVDRGAYRDYITNEGSSNYSTYFRRNSTLFEGDRFGKDIWNGGWAAIRVVNIGLQALADGKLTEATTEQRQFLEGQLYFWRAYFHFQSSVWFGGLPYVDTVLPSDDPLRMPRLSYQEMADKCIADLKIAIEKLPIEWDVTATGAITKGNNELRPNKIWAMAMLGKVQLYAGSPLMNAGVNGQPTDYNKEYCANAADTFGELLALVESGQTKYELANFDRYSDLFYTRGQNWKMPGVKEAIIVGPDHQTDSYWRQTNSYQPTDMANGDGVVLHPSANYVQYYGMANGLPLDNPESGWTNTQPWKDRDPRFYHDIIFDGLKMVNRELNGIESIWQYADLGKSDTYTGSYRRDPSHTSRTGYLMYKLIPKDANKWDDGHNSWGYTLNQGLTELRLADVYLMYAEAAAQGYSGAGNAKSPKFSKTAAEAINTVRDRAGVGHVAQKYVSNLESFMSEVRRERAVELAFEAHRFHDLRRWLLLTRAPYNIKTALYFERDGEFDPNEDPKERRVKGWKEEVLIQRNLGTKHYWMPFKTEDVTMYPEFVQNPGW